MEEIGTQKPLNFLKIKDEIFMWHDLRYLPPSTEKRNLSDYESNAIKQKLPNRIFYGFKKIFYTNVNFFISFYRANDK